MSFNTKPAPKTKMCFLPATTQMAYFLHVSPAHPVQYCQDYDCNTAGGTDNFECQTMSGVRKQEETNTLMIFHAVVVGNRMNLDVFMYSRYIDVLFWLYKIHHLCAYNGHT